MISDIFDGDVIRVAMGRMNSSIVKLVVTEKYCLLFFILYSSIHLNRSVRRDTFLQIAYKTNYRSAISRITVHVNINVIFHMWCFFMF